jgi:cytochrome c5
MALWAVTAQAMTDDAIAERLKPAGQVCVMGEECKDYGYVAVAAGGAARTADDIGKHVPATCRAVGAPKIGDTAAWKGSPMQRVVSTVSWLQRLPVSTHAGEEHCADWRRRTAWCHSEDVGL